MTESTRELPRLIVVFDPIVPTLGIIEASEGIWQTVWMVDRADEEVAEWVRVLRRLGEVVDVTGLGADGAATAAAEHQPKGIVAFTDAGVPPAAAIGTRLGLPAYSATTAERLSNKVAQRAALRAAGVAVPDFRSLPAGTTSEELARIAERLNYPVIVKPQTGAGSRDTYRAADAGELLAVFDGRVRLDSDLIIEEQLVDAWSREQHPYADMVSVESIVAHGRLSHLAVTGRTTLAPPFRETGYFIPSNLPADTLEAVLDTAGQAVAAMDTDTGVFHTEVKLTPNGPRVIEVNGRVGAHVGQNLKFAAGHSMYTIAGRVALGEAVTYEDLLPCAQIGYSIFIVPPVDATKLIKLDGLTDLNQIPGTHNIVLDHVVGDRLDWREGTASRVLTVFGGATDHTTMWAARKQILETIDIDYDRA